jgi:NAD(P)-dependent dehydrogenase (short-subunit alcohol dehydrogenase family)
MTPVWFITAASSGFGHELVLSALSRGHKVIATARTLKKIDDLKSAGADTMTLDITAPLPELQAVVRAVEKKYGRVDYLVNAAGYILEGCIEETSPEESYQQFNTNVFGALNVIRAFLPLLRTQKSPESGPRATIAQFSSLGAWMGGPGCGLYVMSKAAASMIAESLRPELSPFNINVTAVEPGYFRTGFLTSNARVIAANHIDVYEDENIPSGQMKKVLTAQNGQQLGDVKKGVKVLVDILTSTGVAEGKELPVRLILGSDCEAVIREKCNSTLRSMDEWGPIARLTDYTD